MFISLLNNFRNITQTTITQRSCFQTNLLKFAVNDNLDVVFEGLKLYYNLFIDDDGYVSYPKYNSYPGYNMYPNHSLRELVEVIFLDSVDDLDNYIQIDDNHGDILILENSYKLYLKPAFNWIHESKELYEDNIYKTQLMYNIIENIDGFNHDQRIFDVIPIEEDDNSLTNYRNIQLITRFFEDIYYEVYKDCSNSRDLRSKIRLNIRSRINEFEYKQYDLREILEKYMNRYHIHECIPNEITIIDFIYYIGLWNMNYTDNEIFEELRDSYSNHIKDFEINDDIKSIFDFTINHVVCGIFDLINKGFTELIIQYTPFEKVLFLCEEATQLDGNANMIYHIEDSILLAQSRNIRTMNYETNNIIFKSIDIRKTYSVIDIESQDMVRKTVQIIQKDVFKSILRKSNYDLKNVFNKHKSGMSSKNYYEKYLKNIPLYQKTPDIFSILVLIGNYYSCDSKPYRNQEINQENNFGPYQNWNESPMMYNFTYKELLSIMISIYNCIVTYSLSKQNPIIKVLKRVVKDILVTISSPDELQKFYMFATNESLDDNVKTIILNGDYNCYQYLQNYRWKFDLMLVLCSHALLKDLFNIYDVDLKWTMESIYYEFSNENRFPLNEYLKYLDIFETEMRKELHRLFIRQDDKLVDKHVDNQQVNKIPIRQYENDYYFNKVFSSIDLSSKIFKEVFSEVMVIFGTIRMDMNFLKYYLETDDKTMIIFYGGGYHGNLYHNLLRRDSN